MLNKIKTWLSNSVKDAPHDLIDQGVKEFSKWLASSTPQRLNPETIKWLTDHPRLVRHLWSVRFLIPNQGEAWHAVNEFVTDFHSRLEEEIKHAGHATKPENLEDVIRIELAALHNNVEVLGLIKQTAHDVDEPTRDQFNDWFSSTPTRRQKFVRLVSGKTLDEIKRYVMLDPADLEELIAAIPEAVPHLEFLKLRLAAESDPELKQLLADDMAVLNAKGPNQSIEFWFAVKRAVEESRIKSIDEFKDMMKLPPEEAFRNLGFRIREKGAWQSYLEWHKTSADNYADSGLLKWSAELRKKSQRIGKAPRG